MEEIMNKSTITNKVSLMGKISSDFRFSHKSKGIRYYIADIDIKRISGYIDRIPVMFTENIYKLPKSGSNVHIEGQFQSRNQYIDGQTKVLLKVLALNVEPLNKKDMDIDKNKIFLHGYICKQPRYRKTPMGRRISDVCLAVNSPNKHCDYLPCIFWGRNAKIVSRLPVGYQIKIWGRIQSRIYSKKTERGLEERTAYEVSVSRMEF